MAGPAAIPTRKAMAGIHTAVEAIHPTASSDGVKRVIIERAERRLLLVDQGKFEVRSLQLVCLLGELDTQRRSDNQHFPTM